MDNNRFSHRLKVLNRLKSTINEEIGDLEREKYQLYCELIDEIFSVRTFEIDNNIFHAFDIEVGSDKGSRALLISQHDRCYEIKKHILAHSLSIDSSDFCTFSFNACIPRNFEDEKYLDNLINIKFNECTSILSHLSWSYDPHSGTYEDPFCLLYSSVAL